jgi:hypothetical protein
MAQAKWIKSIAIFKTKRATIKPTGLPICNLGNYKSRFI